MKEEKERKAVYEVCGRWNGKPAGFVGRYRTRKEADEDRIHSHVSTIVKRVYISEEEYKAWEKSGYKTRGWGMPNEERYHTKQNNTKEEEREL